MKYKNRLCWFMLVLGSFGLCSQLMAIELVSVSSSGEPDYAGRHNERNESISADNRFVAFTSESSNLVSGDTNGISDVFVHDRETGITERVSVSSSGEQAIPSVYDRFKTGSSSPTISADGRYVAFSSTAINLVPDDINDYLSDVFLHDRLTGTTELVSYSQNGEQRTYYSLSPSISADGRYISYRTNQIYLFDRVTKTTVRVSRSPDGKLANNSSGDSTISADGRFVAYASYSSNIDPDCIYQRHIFVYDRISRANECISKLSSGEQGNSNSSNPSISADGRFVSFSSDASNLTPADLNGNVADIFVHDRQTGIIELVSVSSSGEQGNYLHTSSFLSSISANGRFVAFDNYATNLVPGGTDGKTHIYVRDRVSKVTELVSKSAIGEHANSFSYAPTISPDGQFVLFQSSSTNLVEEDINGRRNILITENPLESTENNLVTIEKLINNETRETQDKAAQLATGTLYRQSYKVTNDSPNRIYQVQVFENGGLMCNFYALEPGQSRQRCDTFQTVEDGDQHVQVTFTAKVSGSGQALSSTTDAYYTGHSNFVGELVVTHRINNTNADARDQAPILASQSASILFKVENTGDIELYQVKAYHDPVSPVNSGWDLQCVLGPMKPGQVRYCKKDIQLTDTGLNQAIGRVQGRNAIMSATDVSNASNPTYFIAP